MTIDLWLIGNANTIQLSDFRDSISGNLESNVTAFVSLCEPSAPSGGTWLVENATNAGPIVITSTNHGLTTNDWITILNVGDNRGAHGTFQVTVIDANNFSLCGSNGTGTYSRGGQFYRCLPDCNGLPFALAGIGQYSVTIQGNIGLVPGNQYTVALYCTGDYRDLWNEIDRVTARTRGNG